MIGLMKMVAASTVAVTVVSGSAAGGGSDGLLCPMYADAAKVTAEGMDEGISFSESLSIADGAVSDPDVLIVLKVVIAYVYQERARPSDAYAIVLNACMTDRW